MAKYTASYTYFYTLTENEAREILTSMGLIPYEHYKGNATIEWEHNQNYQWFDFYCNPQGIVNSNVKIDHSAFQLVSEVTA